MKWIMAFGLVLQEAARGWSKHRAQSMGAALAFYTALSFAPIAIIAISIAGYFLGEDAARGEIVDRIEYWVGKNGAITFESLIQKASEPQPSRIATACSVGMLLLSAMGVFAELKDSLDIVWEVKRKLGLGLGTMIKTQLLSFVLVIGTGFLLVVSLLLTALLTALTHWAILWLPVPVWAVHLLEGLVSVLVITILFALIFKLLPDVNVSWKAVWFGAVVTAILFMIGKIPMGTYIGSTGLGSIYGAAGSLVVLLVWTYYSSQILFFGAELSRAFVQSRDSKTNH